VTSGVIIEPPNRAKSFLFGRLTTLLGDFSGSRNVRVARGQKECLNQGL
jgi:hypothetical protein